VSPYVILRPRAKNKNGEKNEIRLSNALLFDAASVGAGTGRHLPEIPV
jgi:hypothetical protein